MYYLKYMEKKEYNVFKGIEKEEIIMAMPLTKIIIAAVIMKTNTITMMIMRIKISKHINYKNM